MNLIGFLKSIGHGLDTVAKDIEKGLEVIDPIISTIPGIGTELGPILSEVQFILKTAIAAGAKLESSHVSQITQLTAQSVALRQVAASTMAVQPGTYTIAPVLPVSASTSTK